MKEHRFFFAWDEVKEMDYLAAKAREGYMLTKVNLFTYYFEADQPKAYQYAAEFRFMDQMKESEYLQIFSDAGWTYVTNFGGWYYFRSLESQPFYNDYSSQKSKYWRLLIFLLLTGFPLYYQLLIFYPNMKPMESFYQVFKWVLYCLVPLHFYAFVRVLSIYNKLKHKIHE